MQTTSLTQQYVERISYAFPRLSIEQATPNTTGWDSFVLEVNGNLIFRFPLRPEIEAELRTESELLRELANVLSVPVPDYKYIWKGDATYTHPFVGYPKIEGVHPHQLVNSPVRDILAAELGTFISSLHAFPIEQAIEAGVREYSQEAWWRVHAQRSPEVEGVIRPLVSAEQWAQIDAQWHSLVATLKGSAFRPVFVHNDLFSSHIFCDPNSGLLTGIIDWGDAGIGDPAKDFGGLLYDCGSVFTEQVAAHYTGEQGANFRGRIRHYAFRIHFSEILYAHSNNDLPTVNARLEQLLSDLEPLDQSIR